MTDEDNTAAKDMLLGLASAAAGFTPGAPLASFGLDLMRDHSRRKADRRAKRATRIIENLALRLKDLEQEPSLTEATVDLFSEVYERAACDDDSEKECVTTCILDWIIRSAPSRTEVVMISRAVENLTYGELYAFFTHYAYEKTELSSDPIPFAMWDVIQTRLSNYGLIKEEVDELPVATLGNQNIRFSDYVRYERTKLGAMLCSICSPFTGFPIPSGFERSGLE